MMHGQRKIKLLNVRLIFSAYLPKSLFIRKRILGDPVINIQRSSSRVSVVLAVF
jgi:hypothetical protein